MTMDNLSPDGYKAFFQDKVLFITGATGNVGLCTLYKLATELHAKKIFGLVRGSEDQAMSKIHQKMPDQANFISNCSQIQFLVGDMCLPRMGLSQEELQCLEDEVNIVIHTAAVISLFDPINECVRHNCDPTLELAHMATSFRKLQKFVFVSSAFAHSFLPDGTVEEKVYPLLDSAGEDIDPEYEWEEIKRTGHSDLTDRFAWPYALSKYLAERLLLARHSSLPLLIVRPGSIAPAFDTPFSLYGSERSFPLQFAAKIFLRDPQANSIWHKPTKCAPGQNIFDEIPVDFVSKTLLLHIVAQHQGVVHATAACNYVQQTVNDGLMVLFRGGPDEARDDVEIKWVDADEGPQCALGNMFVVAHRDWHFSCSKSMAFSGVEGPLRIGATFEQAQAYNINRYRAMLGEVRLESLA